ncbi:MAG: NADH-quinone oxidoreductase subunit N [Bacteroidia bacterium]|nr:NADH-quinone oxidoreductase subunit N [Bacteroidia bacterium]
MESLAFSLSALSESTQFTLPLLVLLGTGLLLMLLDAFQVRTILPWVAGAGLALSAGLSAMSLGTDSRIAFFGMMETGGIAPLIHIFLSLSGLFTLFFLGSYLHRYGRDVYDVYALVIFAVIGMILLANAHDLIMTFIGLETMSMCLYIFAALFKTDTRSNESALKYFLLGSFASGFLLFGIALIYGITGYTNFTMLAQPESVAAIQAQLPVFYVGVALLLTGLLFKVSAFPFHMWTPDVYEGTPTPLAGFMATGSKMASFLALGVIMQELQLDAHTRITTLVALSAVLTMIYGNLVAARQQNIKRMLAYSSIAHSGYVLLGLCASAAGFQAMVFYMFIYTLMNIGAFGLVGMAEAQYPDTQLDAWKGLGQKNPAFAGAMAVFLFSLAGIPPLAGFMSKYQIFLSAIREDLLVLAIIGILASVVGAYYYIRLIVLMFFPGEDQPNALNITLARAPLVGAALLVLLIIVLGVFPALVLDPIQAAFGPQVAVTTAVLP